jgi:hypothetical protein
MKVVGDHLDRSNIARVPVQNAERDTEFISRLSLSFIGVAILVSEVNLVVLKQI